MLDSGLIKRYHPHIFHRLVSDLYSISVNTLILSIGIDMWGVGLLHYLCNLSLLYIQVFV